MNLFCSGEWHSGQDNDDEALMDKQTSLLFLRIILYALSNPGQGMRNRENSCITIEQARTHGHTRSKALTHEQRCEKEKIKIYIEALPRAMYGR